MPPLYSVYLKKLTQLVPPWRERYTEKTQRGTEEELLIILLYGYS